jgi:hypothetical protein
LFGCYLYHVPKKVKQRTEINQIQGNLKSSLSGVLQNNNGYKKTIDVGALVYTGLVLRQYKLNNGSGKTIHLGRTYQGFTVQANRNIR